MTIISIENYQPQQNDIFLFDSNIWVYLFDNTCIPEYYIKNSIDKYAEFYKKVISARAKILITSFNIAEITKKLINNDKYAYIANFSITSYKKDYRASQAYTNLLSLIKTVNASILKTANKVSDRFEDFNDVHFFNQDIDFIDEYLAFLTQHYACKLVTHDKDFKNCGRDIDILTDNSKLLNR